MSAPMAVELDNPQGLRVVEQVGVVVKQVHHLSNKSNISHKYSNNYL